MRFIHSIVWITSLAAPLAAQSSDPHLRPIGEAGIRDGGTFHVASGTWTRKAPQGLISGQEVIYSNTANTGMYYTAGIELETNSVGLLDFGRVPIVGGPSGAYEYEVNCVTIAYCVENDAAASGPLDVSFEFQTNGSSCAAGPAGLVIASYMGGGLPNADPVLAGQGLPTCWTVQFDLSGGGEFCMHAEGDGVFDNILEFDQFAIGLEFDPQGTGGYVGAIAVGPVVAGDRNWTSGSFPEILTTGNGGGGTFYSPGETCVPTVPGPNSSGLDNEDGWWIGARPAQGLSSGCYTFGGYDNWLGCNADGPFDGAYTPPASFYAELSHDPSVMASCGHGPQVPGIAFCDPGQNTSLGTPAVLSGTFDANAESGVHLDVTGGPPTKFGYFLVGTAAETQSPIPISHGLLCLSVTGGNSFSRYNIHSGPLNSIGQFNANTDFVNLVGTSSTGFGFDLPLALPFGGNPSIQAGQTWHFQCWFRDFGAIPTSNLTNGYSVQF